MHLRGMKIVFVGFVIFVVDNSKAPRYFLRVNQDVPEKSSDFRVEFSGRSPQRHRDTENEKLSDFR